MGMSLAMIPGNENHFYAALSLFTVLVTSDARKQITISGDRCSRTSFVACLAEGCD